MKEKVDAAIALAENIVNITYDDIPREAVEVTKKDILDVIAVAIAAGSIAPGCREIVELAREEGGKKESTILSYGGKASSCMAAFANGAMTHSLDYDDTFDRGATHLGTGTVPAALAIAERVGKVTGKVRPGFDDKLKGFSARVEIETVTGVYSKEVDLAYGHPQKPLSEEDLISKAKDCLSYSVKPMSREKVEQLIERCSYLENETDMRQFAAMLG